MKSFIPNLRQVSGMVMIINTFLPIIILVAVWWIANAQREDICKTVRNTKEALKVYGQSEQNNSAQTKEIDCGLFDLAESIYQPFREDIKKITSEIDGLSDKLEKFKDKNFFDGELIKVKIKEVKFDNVHIELPTKIKKPKYVKKAEDDINKEINDNIVSPLTKQINKIPYTVKSVADVMINPQADNIYKKIKDLESNWIKIRKDLDNYLFNPLKTIYQKWKSIFLIILWIALIWIALTYFVWSYRRLSVGWDLLLNRSV